jgi:membrane protease subunit HflK
VFEIYRPRVKGQAEHPLYESRLIGILGQPGGLITTAAQALDYQFGFKVSETWFYKFLEGALAWIILVQLGVLVLSTCVVIIGPGEGALLQRFGKPAGGVLKPGAHFKLPWPIDRVTRYEADRVHMFTVGIEAEEAHKQQRVLVWGKSHAKEEFDLLVASREQPATNSLGGEQSVPVNLLAVNLPVQFQIKNLEEYAYNYADAAAMLKFIAFSELTRYLVSVDLNDIMAAGRRKAASDLLERIQKRADDVRLGVKILFVGLHGIHPPVKVAPDFEKVIGALQDKAATNHYARAYAAEIVPLARADAARRINEAEAYLYRATALAAASSARFTNQLAAYEASPSVYKYRLYLESLTRGLEGDRKYVIVPTNLHEVITLNLEDKLREDLLDLKLPPSTKK